MADIQQIMALFNESGGTGVRLDGKPYPIRKDEPPLRYFKRVMEEHNAWKAGQEAQAPSPSKDTTSSSDGGGQRENPVDRSPDRGRREETVQGSEESLERTLQSKVASLRRSRGSWQRETAEAIRHLSECEESLKEVERELKFAEEFLARLSPEVRDETSESVSEKETAVSGGGSGVGAPSSPVEDERGSSAGDTEA